MVVLVLGLVVWSALIEAPDHRLDGRYAVELPPGQTMIFAVEPETTDVLVVSSTLVQRDAPPDSRRAHDYVICLLYTSDAADAPTRLVLCASRTPIITHLISHTPR